MRSSGLVPPAEFDAVVAELAAGGSAPSFRAVIDRLVADNYLTPFHADRLLIGKYKGFRLGSYVILDRIGAGGMGQVFLAEHADLRRRAAIKVLSLPVAVDEVARQRFYREARAAATLDHPNIVRVFDLNQDGQLLYLVMEYIEGINLQALVYRAGLVDPSAAAFYAGQAALGLQHAHEKGLIHRDVKPGNLLVDRIGACRVLDLGLVRSVDADDAQLTNNLGGKTVLGTVDYLAPEQAVNSSAVDARADVYSLGATLYFMLAGRPMFPDGSAAEKLVAQQSKDPEPIRRVRPAVPAGLAEVVHRALAKDPAQRFPSAAAMANALAPFAVAATPDPTLIADPPAWRGLRRSGDGGSYVRLGQPQPRSGRPDSGTASTVSRTRAVTPPAGRGLPSWPPPVRSPSATTPGRAIPPPATRPPGGPDQPSSDSITDAAPRPGFSVGDSNILSTAEAKQLAGITNSTPGTRAPPPERLGVPMPIMIGMMALSAAVTGVVVWLAATR